MRYCNAFEKHEASVMLSKVRTCLLESPFNRHAKRA
jgi:hypothetical protein